MIYANGVVSVDNNFARFGSKSFAINKINTVDVRVARPYGWAPLIVFGGLSALFLLLAFGAVAKNVAVICLVIAAMFAALAYWGWKRTKRREYHLFLMTSSSSSQAYTTRDPDEIYKLRLAIEDAMSREQSMAHRHELAMPDKDDRDRDPIVMKPAATSARPRALGKFK